MLDKCPDGHALVKMLAHNVYACCSQPDESRPPRVIDVWTAGAAGDPYGFTRVASNDGGITLPANYKTKTALCLLAQAALNSQFWLDDFRTGALTNHLTELGNVVYQISQEFDGSDTEPREWCAVTTHVGVKDGYQRDLYDIAIRRHLPTDTNNLPPAERTALSEVYYPGSPDDMRAKGWFVGGHNDYPQNGRRYVYWTLNNPETGRFVKGEGLTDSEALDQCREQIARLESQAGVRS